MFGVAPVGQLVLLVELSRILVLIHIWVDSFTVDDYYTYFVTPSACRISRADFRYDPAEAIVPYIHGSVQSSFSLMVVKIPPEEECRHMHPIMYYMLTVA